MYIDSVNKGDHNMKQATWTAEQLKALNRVARNIYRQSWESLSYEEREHLIDIMEVTPENWEVKESKSGKFYYNGKLIRTSKSHHYTHAVIDMETGKVKGCRSNREAAEAIIASQINFLNDVIANCNNAIKAIQNGESRYICREGKRTYRMQVSSEVDYQSYIDMDTEAIENVKRNWKVVELEER